MSNIKMPIDAENIITALNRKGFSAYLVGGCIRDRLLGVEPHDWDICTSATPEIVKDTFCHTVDTGIKHGTVTVITNSGGYEVTTYKIPDGAILTGDIIDDLARRDFTINAMAYSKDGLIDRFGGVRDLKNRIIRGVGNPDDRFHEDSLRILRALRFSAVYDFSIDSETKTAIHRNAHLLSNISNERICAEVCKIISGIGSRRILLEYSDVISVVIPEIKCCIGFPQNNRFHTYNVYEHMVRALEEYKGTDLSVKFALLIHDIGKPKCYTEDENGGHFYGHQSVSYDISKSVVERLGFDNNTKIEILDLIRLHDSLIEPTEKSIKRWLNKIGEKRLYQLMDVRMADMRAHAENTQELRIKECECAREIIDSVTELSQCFSKKDMLVNGNDIISLGVKQGVSVGELLNELIDEIISGAVLNDRDKLIERLRYKIKERNG